MNVCNCAQGKTLHLKVCPNTRKAKTKTKARQLRIVSALKADWLAHWLAGVLRLLHNKNKYTYKQAAAANQTQIRHFTDTRKTNKMLCIWERERERHRERERE